jgi:hypothetical protein
MVGEGFEFVRPLVEYKGHSSKNGSRSAIWADLHLERVWIGRHLKFFLVPSIITILEIFWVIPCLVTFILHQHPFISHSFPTEVEYKMACCMNQSKTFQTDIKFHHFPAK